MLPVARRGILEEREGSLGGSVTAIVVQVGMAVVVSPRGDLVRGVVIEGDVQLIVSHSPPVHLELLLNYFFNIYI